jgi:hypothetical protein
LAALPQRPAIHLRWDLWRRRAEMHNDKLPKLHKFEVPELEQALTQAGFEGFEPLVYGEVIIFRARKGK